MHDNPNPNPNTHLEEAVVSEAAQRLLLEAFDGAQRMERVQHGAALHRGPRGHHRHPPEQLAQV